MPLQTERMTGDVRFKVYPDQLKKLEEFCYRSNRTKADVLRSWLRRFLDEFTEDKYSGSPDEDRYKDTGSPS